jgi:hypothetical protein
VDTIREVKQSAIIIIKLLPFSQPQKLLQIFSKNNLMSGNDITLKDFCYSDALKDLKLLSKNI